MGQLCLVWKLQKVICKGDEAILKDNSQRSKWAVTGPGGLDMVIPSVCLILPPPNPLSINLAIKNEQCYESIMSFWNQLYINVKSLIAWHYCLLDIERINSLTISMLARMNPEEYSQFINSLETHYEEFKRSCQGSQMFVENDKRGIESQYNAAQAYYGTLVVQLPTYRESPAENRVASSSHTLTELQALRLKLAAAEGLLSQHVHICLGDDGVKDCGLKITHLEVSANGQQKDKPRKGHRYRTLIVLGNLSNYLLRLRALRDLLQSMARAEDIVKVHEARLTEKETTSLLPGEVNDYLRDELDGKRDVVASMEAELAKALHWNGQVGGPLYRCDMMLSNCAEQVGQLSDRWRRIQAQIDTRYVQDLQRYLPQLEHYKQSSSSFHDWIGDTGKKQAILQATHIQNALNAEIKAKRETLESVLKDNDACVTAIKDYETDLASYTSGLETLLNIPIKRTMLRSPSMDLIQEAAQLQTRYMELLTSSDNYLKFIGELLKNMEDLKIRSTRIDVLEEELRMLREALQDRKSKNKALEDAVARYQLELSQSQEKLLSVEEMKRTTALQCDAAKDSLDDTHNQLADLADQVTRLNYLLEEEKRKRKLAEERYTKQQEEYESVLRKRQTELESVSWSKVEVEKTMGNQEHEMKQLRRKLEEETSKAAELRKEISKVRSQCDAKIDNLKLDYDSQIHVSHTTIQRLSAQREDDARQLQLRYDRIQAERRVMEEELGRLKMATAHAEERLRRAEEEAHRQRLVIAEEGRARREVQNEIEVLIKQQEERSNKHQEALAEVEQDLEQKMEQLAYVTHSLEEEVRRRKTTEEGKHVLEQTLAELQAKLASSAMAAAQLTECEAERQNVRLTLEREIRDRSRIEENLNRLQGRVKDIQSVRDGLELQLAHLREANQEEVSKRRQIETELEKTTTTMREYYCAMTALRQKREQVEASERKGEERCLMMQEELERSMEKNKTSVEQISQLSTELKALQQQLLQEQAKIQEVTQRNEGLCRTLEAKTEALNMNSSEVQSLQEKTETLAKERLRLEEELRTTRHDNAELLRFKEEHDDEVSSQITALELQLQASERRNVDYRNLVSELSLERANLKLETEKIQIQAAETSTAMLSLQSQCSETERERDALLLKLQLSGTDKDNLQKLEEEHRHVKLSLESELQKNQRVQDENDRLKRDLSYWKEQCQSKQGLVDQYDADKERLERERRSLEREIEKLRKELSDSEKTYRGKLAVLQKEVTELTILRQNAQDEAHTGLLLLPVTERKDPSKLVFDGVRKTVTAQQLFDCGVLDKATFNQLITGEKTVPEVSVEKQVFLKGSGVIAGVSVGSFQKMSLTQAKKQSILSPESADLLLEAQAATGHIIDPQTNQKLTVIEACARGVVCQEDESKLFAAEAAAIGYRDPNTLSLLSAGQAMKKGLVDKDTALRMLQAQECAGGILDPALGVFLPRDIAMDRNLIDADLYKALSESPQCYLDPDTQLPVSYLSLKKRCRADTITGLLLLPEPKKPTTVQGLRSQVSVIDLVNANLLEPTDINELKEGRLTGQDIEYRLRSYLGKSTCIAGLFDETTDRVMTFYEGMKGGLLQPETTLKLLEAQAASGFIVDPVNNRHLTVNDAYNRGLFGPECLDKLLSAEKAVTGYKLPGTEKVLSLFQAIKRGLVVEGHGIRLLEAQIASGGIIDPDRSHRIDIDVAYSRGYLDEAMTKILTDPEVARKDFFDPNTEENLTYMELKKRCMTDGMTGLVLLPIADKEKEEATMKNTLRKRRVIIVDPQTNKEMNVREAYEKGYIDYSTYLELSQQECEWEEITITEPDGSTRFVIIDKKTGTEYDISELLEKRVIDQSVFDQYRSSTITLTQFADIITEKSQRGLPPTSSTLPSSSSSVMSKSSLTKITTTIPPTIKEHSFATSSGSQVSYDAPNKVSSVSVTLASPVESVGGKDPVGAIFDTETLEKISITEALNRGLVDTITAQRLLEAQACTGGIVNPENGRRLSVQEASRQGIINDDMAAKLKPAQKVFIGFEGVKTGKKMSAAEAMKEMWLPYEAGQRFMEFQFVTGGLYDPELGCRRTTEDALKMGWIDGSAAMKLQDIRNHTKNLTCPKSKLKISYKEALDNCLVEESTGLRMLPASSVSSRGISSPYNFASAPGSSTGSRSGSRRSSRRSSLDLGSPTSLSTTSHTVLTTLSTTSQMNKK
uniref:Desmoplakin n=1 Tax=Hippocampus comes TaxID=109280 RepID=A0A3Q2XP48_HIPCM